MNAKALPIAVVLATVAGCSSSHDGRTATQPGVAAGGSSSSGGAPTSGGEENGGAAGASGGESSGGGAGAGGNGGARPFDRDASVLSNPTLADAGSSGSTIVHGGPGCGLPSAAFCDTFDAPSTNAGRAGELNASEWSAGRLAPQLPSGNGNAIGIGPGTVPKCRDGLPATASPDQDALICDPTPGISDPHLLVIAAAQNYGQNSYRIRQPFDFAGRTGKIVFDAQGYNINGLLGWISLDITADPINAPSFSLGAAGVNNNEGSLVPENAVEVQFQAACTAYSTTPVFGVSMIDVIHEYADDVHQQTGTPTCVATAKDQLNHIEIDVSQQHIQVSATPVSTDGKTFAAPVVLFDTDANVPFSRGWVQITTHNHATLKYSGPNAGFGVTESLDSWTARWDNVGFDGPVLSNWREYSIPDSLIPGMNAWNRPGPVVNIGYLVADAADPPKQTLHFTNVDVTDVETARLSLAGWYLNQSDNPLSSFVLRYRLNGKSWHDRPFTAGELAQLGGTHTQGQLGQIIDVPLTDLVQGDNSLEFLTVNVPQNYPPIVANIDLVLATK